MTDPEATGEQTFANVGGVKITKNQARQFGLPGILISYILTGSVGFGAVSSFDLLGIHQYKERLAAADVREKAMQEKYDGMLREWAFCMRAAGAPLSDGVLPE